MDPNKLKCFDIIIFGNCTRRKECPICTRPLQQPQTQSGFFCNFDMNKVEDFVPKRKQQPNKNTNQVSLMIPEIKQEASIGETNEAFSKLRFNLDAEEYVPKSLNGQNNFILRELEEENVNVEGEELEVIMKDLLDDEELDGNEDDEKWWPKYQNCECCKGYVYKCSGKACEHMDSCYCKVQDEMENYN